VADISATTWIPVNNDDGWVTIKLSKHTITTKTKHSSTLKQKHSPSYYHHLSHRYATLPEFAVDPPIQSTDHNKTITQQHASSLLSIPSTHKHKARRKFLERQHKREEQAKQDAADNKFSDHHIQWAEDKQTELEKINPSKGQLVVKAVDHKPHEPVPILQHSGNKSYTLAASGMSKASCCSNTETKCKAGDTVSFKEGI
jgi:hypothetical protein